MSAPKRPKRPADFNRRAFQIVQEATAEVSEAPDVSEAPTPVEPQKNPHAVALGKLGGSKGGKKRAERLSAEQRAEIAKKAARKRWAKD